MDILKYLGFRVLKLVCKYSVYKAKSENGAYILLKDDITAINYIDRNVEEGVTYYYKVAVRDITE